MHCTQFGIRIGLEIQDRSSSELVRMFKLQGSEISADISCLELYTKCVKVIIALQISHYSFACSRENYLVNYSNLWIFFGYANSRFCAKSTVRSI